MKNTTTARKGNSKAAGKANQESATFIVNPEILVRRPHTLLDVMTRDKQPNDEVIKYRKKMYELKQSMYDYFNGKITAIKLIEWLARANEIVATSNALSDEERSKASNVLYHLSSHILPVLIDPEALPEDVKDALVTGISAGNECYSYAEDGIGSIGVAFFKQKGSSSPDFISEFTGPLSMFLEMLQIYRDYEDYERWLLAAKEKDAAAAQA
jgi:hypothetical protein